MPSFEEVRAAFPVLEQYAYLNAGTNGPLPRVAAEAMIAEQLVDVAQGRGGEPYFSRALGMRDEVRAKLAALFGVEPTQVALTRSTTDGCNIVLAGLDLGPDDEVVTSDVEHFGLIGPLHASGARIVTAPEDGILEAVTDRTRLIAISHVSWVTGNSLDPARIKAETGLPILVDGAQSAGVIPVEAGAIDYYAVSCQKWLCGPDVTGALVVARPGRRCPSRSRATSRRPSTSPTARTSSGRARSASTAAGSERRRSPASRPPSTSRPSGASSGWPRWPPSAATALAERFEVITKPNQAGLVTFRPTSDPTELVEKLRGEGVIVRELPGRNLIRVSCGYWTSDDDLERLLGGLA